MPKAKTKSTTVRKSRSASGEPSTLTESRPEMDREAVLSILGDIDDHRAPIVDYARIIIDLAHTLGDRDEAEKFVLIAGHIIGHAHEIEERQERLICGLSPARAA